MKLSEILGSLHSESPDDRRRARFVMFYCVLLVVSVALVVLDILLWVRADSDPFPNVHAARAALGASFVLV